MKKGHFNWISEVTTIMKYNNMYELQPSTKVEREFFKSELFNRLQSYVEVLKKLRRYAFFKQVIKCIQYLRLANNIKHNIMLGNFRLSSHDVIEQERYGWKSTKSEQWHCKICKLNETQMMKDEFHFSCYIPCKKLSGILC